MRRHWYLGSLLETPPSVNLMVWLQQVVKTETNFGVGKSSPTM